MYNMLPMLYESVFGILALFILTKILGKTQISQLTAFDFIAAVVLGELVGNALFDKEAGIFEIGYVIVIWGSILYLIENITQKFRKSRFILEGKPSLMIHKGDLIYEELRKNKIDLNEFQHLLRMKSVFSVQEVEYAVLESDGTLSILKKSAYQTPNKKDLSLPQSEPQIAMSLIMDGEIIKDNLAEINQTEEWLLAKLKKQDYDDIRTVFYAEWIEGKKLFIQPYTKIKHKDYLKKFK